MSDDNIRSLDDARAAKAATSVRLVSNAEVLALLSPGMWIDEDEGSLVSLDLVPPGTSGCKGIAITIEQAERLGLDMIQVAAEARLHNRCRTR